MVAGEHNIMGLAVKGLHQYDIRCETTDILVRQNENSFYKLCSTHKYPQAIGT